MPQDSVHVQRQENGLIRIRNHRYNRTGRDMGGVLVLDASSVQWLTGAIRGFLEDRKPRRVRFEDDELLVEFSGPDYHPTLAIFNRRREESVEGGSYVQDLHLEPVADLLAQLDALKDSTARMEARLPPAIPVDIDGFSVAMGSAAPGPYPLADGTEAYGRSATVTLLDDGTEQELGVGSALRLGDRVWIAIEFQDDGTLLLRSSEAEELPEPVSNDPNPLVYPDAEMANLWVQWHKPFATWRVDLKPLAERGAAAIETFVRAIIAAGEQREILRILQIADIGYRRDEDGELLPFLEKHWKTQGGPDALGEMSGLILESKVAWFDGTGRLFETPVRHLELILEMDEPYEGAVDGFREQWPPIRIYGPTWDQLRRSRSGGPSPLVELVISLHSDIWFPWITGMSHPRADYKRKFDNRILAERHTPRLNAFLADISKAAEAAGCRLYLDRDETNVRPEYVHDRGIALDIEPPALQMTDLDRNAVWDE